VVNALPKARREARTHQTQGVEAKVTGQGAIEVGQGRLAGKEQLVLAAVDLFACGRGGAKGRVSGEGFGERRKDRHNRRSACAAVCPYRCGGTVAAAAANDLPSCASTRCDDACGVAAAARSAFPLGSSKRCKRSNSTRGGLAEAELSALALPCYKRRFCNSTRHFLFLAVARLLKRCCKFHARWRSWQWAGHRRSRLLCPSSFSPWQDSGRAQRGRWCGQPRGEQHGCCRP